MPAQHPALASPGYRDAVVALKPVQYWRLIESSGTRAIDEMRLGNATYTGTPPQGVMGPPGIKDGAGVRTTTSGGTWVDCGAQTVALAAGSLAVWAFITSQPNPDAGLFGRWQVNSGALLYKPNSTAVGFIKQSTNMTSGAVSMSRWHFFVGTWDGTNMRLYVDGLLVAGPTAGATTPTDPGINWCVGSYGVSNSFTTRIVNGTLAEAAYWNRALSASEVAHLSALGFGR